MTMFGNHDLTGILKAFWLVPGQSSLSCGGAKRGAAVGGAKRKTRPVDEFWVPLHFHRMLSRTPHFCCYGVFRHHESFVATPEQYDAENPAVWNLGKPTYRPRWP